MKFDVSCLSVVRAPGDPFSDWDGIIQAPDVEYRVRSTESGPTRASLEFRSPRGGMVRIEFLRSEDNDAAADVYIDGELLARCSDSKELGDRRLRGFVEAAFRALCRRVNELTEERGRRMEARNRELAGADRRRREALLRRL